MDPQKLSVALEVNNQKHIRLPDKHKISLWDGQKMGSCDGTGDRPAQELQEIYSSLRRRPDGRSVSVVHDFLWRVVALLLGSCP